MSETHKVKVTGEVEYCLQEHPKPRLLLNEDKTTGRVLFTTTEKFDGIGFGSSSEKKHKELETYVKKVLEGMKEEADGFYPSMGGDYWIVSRIYILPVEMDEIDRAKLERYAAFRIFYPIKKNAKRKIHPWIQDTDE